MTIEHNNHDMDEAIVRSIRSMPEAPVPEGFAARVMGAVRPRRPSLWLKARLWLTEPKMVSIRPAYALALALLVLAAGYVGTFAIEDRQAVTGSPVRFVLNDSGMQARSVAVVGSFNGWQAGSAHMRFDAQTGAWVLETTLPPGDHEYMFLVDGDRLMTDPGAQLTRDDGFGNRNSILFVGGPDAMAL